MPKIKSTSQNTAKQKYANYLTKLIILMIVSGIIMMVLASVYYSHFNKSPNITPVSYPKQSLQDLQSQGIFADKDKVAYNECGGYRTLPGRSATAARKAAY